MQVSYILLYLFKNRIEMLVEITLTFLKTEVKTSFFYRFFLNKTKVHFSFKKTDQLYYSLFTIGTTTYHGISLTVCPAVTMKFLMASQPDSSLRFLAPGPCCVSPEPYDTWVTSILWLLSENNWNRVMGKWNEYGSIQPIWIFHINCKRQSFIFFIII